MINKNKIVEEIISDLSDRSGFDLYNLDEDIQDDIKSCWLEIIDNNIDFQIGDEVEIVAEEFSHEYRDLTHIILGIFKDNDKISYTIKTKNQSWGMSDGWKKEDFRKIK